MYPEGPQYGTAALPAGASFWMPRPSEVDAEGIGYFRDTWLIGRVRVGEARELVRTERRIAETVSRLADDPEDFERLASVVEYGYGDDTASELTEDERTAIAAVVTDVLELEGLELGVAGLVHALACVGFIPAASCRSHAADTSWSPMPVVFFAATEYRARALQPLAENVGCTFAIDGARPELLVLEGRSIMNTMALAEAVLAHRRDFVQPRAASPSRPRPHWRSEQGELF